MSRRLPYIALPAIVVVGGLVQGLYGLLYAGIAAAAAGLLLLRLAMVDLRRPGWREDGEEPVPDALQRSFAQVRDELAWSGHSMREFDRTLRPRLSRILGTRLVENRGVRPDQHPGRAEQLVGAGCWQLLDPARPRVLDWDAPGVDLPTIRHVVDRLEAL